MIKTNIKIKKKDILFYGCMILFFIIYLALINRNIGFELSHDEARHATQGLFYQDYLDSIFQEGYRPLSDFLIRYDFKVKVSWWALYDPPFHALVLAILFNIFGSSNFIARIGSELFLLLGLFLIYYIANQILKDRTKAFMSTILFFMLPGVMRFAGLCYIDLPGVVLALGWYIFFFKKGKFSFILSTLFFIAAVMTRYHNILFIPGFILLLVITELFSLFRKNKYRLELRKTKKFLKTDDSIISLYKLFFQFLFLFMIAGRWLWLSLIRHSQFTAQLSQHPNLFSRIFFEAFGKFRGVGMSYWFKFIELTFVESKFFLIFSIIALAFLFIMLKKKQHINIEHKKAWLFVLVIFIISTLFISSRQFRYIFLVVPFLVILSVDGLDKFIHYLFPKRTKLFRQSIFYFVISSFILVSLFSYNAILKEQYSTFGSHNSELEDYISSQDFDKLVLIIRNRIDENTGYVKNYEATIDLVMFQLLSRFRYSDPDNFNTMIMSDDLVIEPEIQHLMKLADLSKVIPVYIIFFKEFYDQPSQIMIDKTLSEKGFVKVDMSYYVLFKKDSNMASSLPDIKLTTIAQMQKEVFEEMDIGINKLRSGEFQEAIAIFAEIYKKQPTEESRLLLMQGLELYSAQLVKQDKNCAAVSALLDAKKLGSVYARVNLPDALMFCSAENYNSGKYQEALDYFALVNLTDVQDPDKKEQYASIISEMTIKAKEKLSLTG